MSYMNVQEAQGCCEAFLLALYGAELFSRWQTLKVKMNFYTEHDFIRWLLEVVDNVEEVSNVVGVESTRTSQRNRIMSPAADDQWMDDDNFNRYLVEAKQLGNEIAANSVSSATDTSGAAVGPRRKRGRPRKVDTAGARETSKRVATEGADGECDLDTSIEAIPMLDFEGGDAGSGEEDSVRVASGGVAAVADPNRVRKFPCQYCGKRFFKRRDKLRHEETVHLRRYVQPCPVCDTVIKRKDHLRRHIKQRHPFFDLRTLSSGTDASTDTTGIGAEMDEDEIGIQQQGLDDSLSRSMVDIGVEEEREEEEGEEGEEEGDDEILVERVDSAAAGTVAPAVDAADDLPRQSNDNRDDIRMLAPTTNNELVTASQDNVSESSQITHDAAATLNQYYHVTSAAETPDVNRIQHVVDSSQQQQQNIPASTTSGSSGGGFHSPTPAIVTAGGTDGEVGGMAGASPPGVAVKCECPGDEGNQRGGAMPALMPISVEAATGAAAGMTGHYESQ